MMKTRILVLLTALFLILPVPGKAQVLPPGAKDRCPVCGMFVAPYPEWVTTIVLTDGEQIYFDGCKDLFRYLFKENIKAEVTDQIYVTDYYRTELVPVRDVFFVLGSDVYGPMGNELIPVVGREQAETFKRDHRGTAVLTYDEITVEVLPQ